MLECQKNQKVFWGHALVALKSENVPLGWDLNQVSCTAAKNYFGHYISKL